MSTSASSRTRRAVFPPSEPSTTAAVCADLAALTVRVFTPEVTDSIRELFSRNAAYCPSEHLPLLGTLVVRHVALSLTDNPPDENLSPNPCVGQATTDSQRESSSRKLPARKKPHRRPRRASYRDLGYQAVVQQKILPEAVELEMLPGTRWDSSTPASVPRRLSISKPETSAEHADLRKTRSVATVRFRRSPEPTSPQPVSPEPRQDIFDEEGPASPTTHLNFEDAGNCFSTQQDPHIRALWRDEGHALFPRADMSSSIRTASRLTGRQRFWAEAEDAGILASAGIPQRGMSRLVQLRKQRLERKGKGLR